MPGASGAPAPGGSKQAEGAIERAVAALGPGPLTEAALGAHVAPLFSRALAEDPARIYLANHSLGRPLDATADDVREGLDAWYARMGGAWDAWMAETTAFRSRIATLLHAPRADCVVPKTSAGQGLRAILNTFERDAVPRVVATRGEFDSLDVILREYARRGRIALSLVEPRADNRFDTADIVGAIGERVDLVVVSEVVFNTGQRLDDVEGIVRATHAADGRMLLDVYHSLGALPVDVQRSDVDFAVGGSYKYLRGGPGACFLYLHSRHLDGSLRTLDIGWFAKRSPFAYERPDPPQFATGGDAFLESTPPVLTAYQARAGQRLVLALGPERIRAYSLLQQRRLVSLLAERGIEAQGGTEDRGAFVVVTDPQAAAWCERLAERGVATDARGRYLRLCPDILTTGAEMARAAEALREIAR
ncbi:MAG TPA: aminotransferase class V-fold PLP-dependent enzyme, partial [Casimicrobiaceae bacterium]|nr:aminotransferase class V-fold PLP-dependent enzyme [Casimicrobiaceae bacterium]